jgi:ribosomal protein S18 acetylase RimI-like enzyme
MTKTRPKKIKKPHPQSRKKRPAKARARKPPARKVPGKKMNALIREARLGDAAGIAKVHVDAWRSTYRGIVPDKVLKGLSYKKREKERRDALKKNDPKYRCFVAENARKRIVGFIVAGPHRGSTARYDGEIYALYLFKEVQGRGIGKALFLRAAAWLQERGHKAALTWVLKDNHPAKGFYAAMGGAELEAKTIDIGEPLVEISYGWKNLRRLSRPVGAGNG